MSDVGSIPLQLLDIPVTPFLFPNCLYWRSFFPGVSCQVAILCYLPRSTVERIRGNGLEMDKGSFLPTNYSFLRSILFLSCSLSFLTFQKLSNRHERRRKECLSLLHGQCQRLPSFPATREVDRVPLGCLLPTASPIPNHSSYPAELAARANLEETWAGGGSPKNQKDQSNFWPWVKTQIVPPVNIPIPTKVGSRMGGEFTYPKICTIGFDPQPYRRVGMTFFFLPPPPTQGEDQRPYFSHKAVWNLQLKSHHRSNHARNYLAPDVKDAPVGFPDMGSNSAGVDIQASTFGL